MRRILLLLAAGWTAALPAHVAVVVCFCSHGGAATECPHAACCGEHDDLPEEGINAGATAPEGGRCVSLSSAHDFVRHGSADAGAPAPAGEPRAVPRGVGPPAALVRPAAPSAAGPPIFLRVRALLV